MYVSLETAITSCRIYCSCEGWSYSNQFRRYAWMDKLHTSLQLIVTYPRPFLPDSFVSLFGIIQSLKTGTTSWDSMWTNSWLFYAVTTFQVCSRTEPQCSFGVCCGRALIAVHAITSAGW